MPETGRRFGLVRAFLGVPFMLAALLLTSVASKSAAEAGVSVAIERAGEAFIIDAVLDVPVALPTAWAVMTDFEHMPRFVGTLTLSKVLQVDGDVLRVRQEGTTKVGFLSLGFESEREVRLQPMQRIKVRSLSGSMKRMDSESVFSSTATGTRVSYHAEMLPESLMARKFGADAVRSGIEEQFRQMAAEMLRRERAASAPVGGN